MVKLKNIKDYTLDELKAALKENGYPSFHATQIFGWIYKRRIEDFDFMTDISKEARRFLSNRFYISKNPLLKREKSIDETEKFLFSLEDKDGIETVLIPESTRMTLCVSSQLGCKFSCAFCLSGQAGFKRNLAPSEIINQYLNVYDLLAPAKITNIVFMGIGEPLDNFPNLIKAIEIFIEPRGIAFGKRKICISTCGIIPQIEKLGRLNLGVKLSISLHSGDDDVRSKLMPINKKYPLKELIKEVRKFAKNQKDPVIFEYVMIKGLNTKAEDAKNLIKLLRGTNYKINLISLNYLGSGFRCPPEEEINRFAEALKEGGAFATVRKSRGQDIEAACGQLRAQPVQENRLRR